MKVISKFCSLLTDDSIGTVEKQKAITYLQVGTEFVGGDKAPRIYYTPGTSLGVDIPGAPVIRPTSNRALKLHATIPNPLVRMNLRC